MRGAFFADSTSKTFLMIKMRPPVSVRKSFHPRSLANTHTHTHTRSHDTRPPTTLHTKTATQGGDQMMMTHTNPESLTQPPPLRAHTTFSIRPHLSSFGSFFFFFFFFDGFHAT